jgi:serine/threonine protein kinase
LIHPNISTILGICIDSSRYWIVEEFFEGGCLFYYLKRLTEFPPTLQLHIAREIHKVSYFSFVLFCFVLFEYSSIDLIFFKGLGFLHGQNPSVIHGDLTSKNIMVCSSLSPPPPLLRLTLSKYRLEKIIK